MIFLIERMDLVTDKFVDNFIPHMPIERQRKANKFKRKIDRDLCVMGYWLLCYAIEKEYGLRFYPQLSLGEYGKPILKDYPNIHFNISHCNAGVVCVVSQNEVGIDIQDIQLYNPLVAKRICSQDELRSLEQCNNPEHLFCKLWTIKESHLKLHGASVECMENKVSADWILTQSNNYVFMHWGMNYHLCCFGEQKDMKIVVVGEEAFHYA